MSFPNPEVIRPEMAIGAPPKPPRTRVIEAPPVLGEPKIPGEIPLPRKRLEKGKLALSVAAGLALGVSIGPKPDNTPEIFNPQKMLSDLGFLSGQALNRALVLIDGFKWGQTEILSTFDPNATKGVIGPNNSVKVTPEEYAVSAPLTVDAEKEKINLPLFVQLPEGFNGAVQYNLKQEEGGKNQIIGLKGLPPGTKILFPFKEGVIAQGAEDVARKKRDGSQRLLYSSIMAKNEDGKEIEAFLWTTGIKLKSDIPVSSGGINHLRTNQNLGLRLNRGDEIGEIITTDNIPDGGQPVQVEILVLNVKYDIQIVENGQGKAVVINNSSQVQSEPNQPPQLKNFEQKFNPHKFAEGGYLKPQYAPRKLGV